MAAEAVLGAAGPEGVLDEIAGAREQPEFAGRDDEVQVGRAGAHRAVALEHVEISRRENFDANPAAMAATRMPEFHEGAQVRGAFHGAAKSCVRKWRSSAIDSCTSASAVCRDSLATPAATSGAQRRASSLTVLTSRFR